MSKPLNQSKLKLEGFNNLAKSLSFNIYAVRYTPTTSQREHYLHYLDEKYNATELEHILEKVAQIIGGTILNIASQDYEPQGASVAMLISDNSTPVKKTVSEKVLIKQNISVAHLDKSHIAIHTYPETHSQRNISTFRADIDISTCGYISPLNAVNYLIRYFEPDIVTIDYKVRGFTCDIEGHKHFIDHEIDSIQDYIDRDIKIHYQIVDMNQHSENIFHTKMVFSDFSLIRYLFDEKSIELTAQTEADIESYLRQEISEIFCGKLLNSN